MHILGRLALKFKYTFTQGRTESAEPGEMCMCASQRICVHAVLGAIHAWMCSMSMLLHQHAWDGGASI
jgi:hypothetical protein